MTQQTELRWIAEARAHIGTREVPGKGDNPKITQWLIKLGAWWRDDATPWCGTFAAHCLKSAGRGVPRHWYRAKAYADGYGTRLTRPAYGCLAVMSRTGGGHVGFVVGRDTQGNLLILGGNQGDAVSIARFPPGRITACIWPEMADGSKSVPRIERYTLPTGSAAASRSEA